MLTAPDFTLISAFLAEVDPSKKTWNFRFALERDGDDARGTHEDFNDLRVEHLKGVLAVRQGEGYGLFVEVVPKKWVRLPGTLDVRTEDSARLGLVQLDSARVILSRARAGGPGDDVAGRAGGSSRGAALDPAEASKGLSEAHRSRLLQRGLTDATIDSAHIYTISQKKTISEKLNRPRWSNGSVCCFPHLGCGVSDPQSSPFRAMPDQRVQVAQHLTVDAVWSADTQGEAYLIPSALEASAYEEPGELFIVLDEIDALYVSQMHPKVVGGESVEVFFDTSYRMDTGGDERLRQSFTANVPLEETPITIFCYPKFAGKKRHEAYKLGKMLVDRGAARVSFVEVKGAFSELVKTHDDLVRLASSARTPNPNELATATPSLQDVLGTDMPPTDLALLIPKDYEVKATGELLAYTTTQTSQGAFQTATRVSLAPFFITRIHREFESRKEKCEIAYKQGQTWTSRVVPSEQVFRRNQIVGLSEYGVPVSDKNAAHAVAWLHDFRELNELEQRFTVIDNFVRTGWHTKEDGTPFYATPGIAGLSFDTQNGHTKQFRARESKSGSLDEQLRIFSEINANYDAGLIAILAASGASILGRVKAATNLWLHTYGQTTSGKSLFMTIASSLYGHPKDMTIKGDATTAGFEQALGAFSGTVVPLDETTLINPEDIPARVYMAYDGIGKARATRTGGVREPLRWHNVVLSTGEKPITDDYSQNGVQVRVLNVQSEELDAAYIPRMYDRILENHGNMIIPWKAMLDGLDYDVLDEEYAAILKRLITRCTEQKVNARVANNLATLCLGGSLLKRCFGNAIYVPENLEDYLFDYMMGDRFARADVRLEHERALEALQSLLFTNPGSILGISEAISKDKQKVIARERIDKNLAFASAWMTEFLRQKGFNPRSVRAAWAKAGILLKASEGRTDTTCSFGGVVGRYVILDARYFVDESVTMSVVTPPEGDGGGGGGGGGNGGGGGGGTPSGGGGGGAPTKTKRGTVHELPKPAEVPVAAKGETAVEGYIPLPVVGSTQMSTITA